MADPKLMIEALVEITSVVGRMRIEMDQMKSEMAKLTTDRIKTERMREEFNKMVSTVRYPPPVEEPSIFLGDDGFTYATRANPDGSPIPVTTTPVPQPAPGGPVSSRKLSPEGGNFFESAPSVKLTFKTDTSLPYTDQGVLHVADHEGCALCDQR